ncbi:MAG TPA: PTS sugar transporter subunit IIB [Lentibacillus sp.]|uniref:PTS sugar transporter subunit IIB n=1 Tax=Lentibacillus sp. TaxID=1925746 RepID=UPI002B4B7C44|nr:PTS sugar transporter subunit IIB [Lentibacillus sp.]HLR63397.1 PTS sugar transporter subunit IIB [Lentibacillus sp.]
MKKLLIMCGTGIATSTIVTEKVKAWLKDMNLNHNVILYQSKISDELGRLNEYDIIVSTTMVPKSMKENVIDGVPLLTGIGIDAMYDEILEKMNG